MIDKCHRRQGTNCSYKACHGHTWSTVTACLPPWLLTGTRATTPSVRQSPAVFSQKYTALSTSTTPSLTASMVMVVLRPSIVPVVTLPGRRIPWV